jgi:hypothetical protein
LSILLRIGKTPVILILNPGNYYLMRSILFRRAASAIFTLIAIASTTRAQTKPAAAEPTTPIARSFHDSRYGVSFTVPAAWSLTRKDGEVSTFALDARTAPHTAQLRAVANITFNPHPYTTFSGAFFYFSVTPRTTPTQCAFQSSALPPRSITTTEIGDLPFTHGYDEHGGICTESRDEIYVTQHNNACYRFDVVINNFCGGDVSGVRDITPRELDAVRNRMQTILDSVHFDSKSNPVALVP